MQRQTTTCHSNREQSKRIHKYSAKLFTVQHKLFYKTAVNYCRIVNGRWFRAGGGKCRGTFQPKISVFRRRIADSLRTIEELRLCSARAKSKHSSPRTKRSSSLFDKGRLPAFYSYRLTCIPASTSCGTDRISKQRLYRSRLPGFGPVAAAASLFMSVCKERCLKTQKHDRAIRELEKHATALKLS